MWFHRLRHIWTTTEYPSAVRSSGNWGGVQMNGTMVSAYDYLKVIGASGGEADYYVYDATNVRLQELSLEYTDQQEISEECLRTSL